MSGDDHVDVSSGPSAGELAIVAQTYSLFARA